MNSTTMEQQIPKYWGIWGSTRSSSSTKRPIPSWAAAAASPYGNEPSWEEQAFARDSAAHLGGCVWPPRSYTCSFCQREFRSAQALGGHMNVHRRDRALLRQGSFPDQDGREAPVEQSQVGPFFYRPAPNPSSATATSSSIAVPAGARGDVILNRGTAPPPPPPPPFLASVIQESKTKLFMSSMRIEAKDQCDHVDDLESGRIKRRRLDPPSVTLPIFVQTTISLVAENKSQGVDHDAKVSKAIISNPSSIPPLLDQQQEVDLELRLGSTPKVT